MVLQTLSFAVPISPISGSDLIRTGAARSTDTIDINGKVSFRAGDLPVVTKVNDLQIDPVPVIGLVCACIRSIENPAFGIGNSGRGVIACGSAMDGVDYEITQDHHTDPPGFSPSPGCFHAPDPECDDEFEITAGVVSRACREQSGDERCDEQVQSRHQGACNSPRKVAYSGNGPRGSATLFRSMAIALLSDRGECDMSIAGMNPCKFADYGPDCVPCTEDDLDNGLPETFPATTGTARSSLYHAGNRNQTVVTEGSGAPCDENSDCTASVCGRAEVCLTDAQDREACGLRCGSLPCATSATGSPFDCSLLAAQPFRGLAGGALAQAFTTIDAPTIGDVVTTATFVFK